MVAVVDKRLLDRGYRFRPPRPGRFWDVLLRPLTSWVYRHMYGVRDLEIRGAEHLAGAVRGGGVMIAVNHPAHGDPFVVFEAMHRLKVPCCYLAAGQLFHGWLGLKGWAFQRLGAFSIDREGTDVRAFRAAVDVLSSGRRPLVIFPEGDVYHLNDRVTPLREGAAVIAITAARRRERGAGAMHIVPAAIRYRYLGDPAPQLAAVMTRLERSVYWRPRPDVALPERIGRFAEAVLGLKEIEYLGAVRAGTLPERIAGLTGHLLAELEQRLRPGSENTGAVPLRVKQLRQQIIGDSAGEDGQPLDEQARRDLEDLHLVTQLSSYPGDYVHGAASIERVAETIDKFEEDALGAEEAGARLPRQAIMSFGEPIPVGGAEAPGASRRQSRAAAGALTTDLERAIQELLDASAKA